MSLQQTEDRKFSLCLSLFSSWMVTEGKLNRDWSTQS